MAIIRMLEKAAGVGSSCDIDHLAESTLDYLAVEMRAMYYDQGADIETKRSIIKNTLKWYTQSRNGQSNRGMKFVRQLRQEIDPKYHYLW